jgi:hypothetical protein
LVGEAFSGTLTGHGKNSADLAVFGRESSGSATARELSKFLESSTISREIHRFPDEATPNSLSDYLK